MANIVPQLTFLGQTCPCVDTILHNNMTQMQNVFLKKIFGCSFPFSISTICVTVCSTFRNIYMVVPSYTTSSFSLQKKNK